MRRLAVVQQAPAFLDRAACLEMGHDARPDLFTLSVRTTPLASVVQAAP